MSQHQAGHVQDTSSPRPGVQQIQAIDRVETGTQEQTTIVLFAYAVQNRECTYYILNFGMSEP